MVRRREGWSSSPGGELRALLEGKRNVWASKGFKEKDIRASSGSRGRRGSGEKAARASWLLTRCYEWSSCRWDGYALPANSSSGTAMARLHPAASITRDRRKASGRRSISKMLCLSHLFEVNGCQVGHVTSTTGLFQNAQAWAMPMSTRSCQEPWQERPRRWMRRNGPTYAVHR